MGVAVGKRVHRPGRRILSLGAGLAILASGLGPSISEVHAAAIAVPDAPAAIAARAAAPLTPAGGGAWSAVMDWGLQAKHMAALPTGKVLVWSTGSNASVWNPTTGAFAAAPALFGDLHCAGQSMLADGRVIVIGGQNVSPHNGTSVTSLFDPVSGAWTQGPDMTSLRWYATSTTLADGRVLATSGDAPDGSRATIPEIYDPIANSWTRLTGANRAQSLYPLMFVLPDTRVFEAGPGSATAILDTSGTGSWTPGPTNAYATNGYSESAVMYAPGKIIRAGGGDPAISRVSVIDMTAATPAWRDVTPMAFPRRRMNLTILADGSVMAIGGTRSADDATQAVLEGEIWSPATEQWTTVAPMAEPRMYHSAAVLLTDGRIVVGGGEAAGRLRAQTYSPPYLFQGPRPVIGAAPATAPYGGSFAIASPDAASITSVALIRLSAGTHAFDQNQRYVPLTFTTGNGSLAVNAPAGGGIAPPGPYQLVIRNGAGVPSVATIIRVDSSRNLVPGSIDGTITDAATSLPIVGASISIGTQIVTSNVAGRYAVAGVPAGDQTVRFSAPGYATVTRLQSVVGGGTYRLDVALAPPGGVAGHVIDSASGLPIGGATVTYPGGETTTGADGSYTINGLASGPELISASAAAHASAAQTPIVPAGGVATVNFALDLMATYITGTVTDAATAQPLANASVTVSAPAGTTTTTDALGRYRLDVAAGTYTVTASAVGHDPLSHAAIVSTGTYAVTDFSLAATVQTPPPPSATLTFNPSADAYISATSPTKNYGGTTVRVRTGTAASPGTYVTYVRFDVSGLAGRPVSGLKLRLYDTDASVDGGAVYAAGNGWTETGITWANAPATTGPSLGAAGRVAANAWAAVTLAPAVISGDGAYTFVLVSGSTDSAYYQSRTGANPPTLELSVGSGAPPPPPPPPPPAAPVASFSVTPASGSAPLAVAVADSSTGTPTSWTWDFGDGTGSVLAAPPPHTYVAAGTYSVSLSVSNANGSSTTSHVVSVTATPPPPPPSQLAAMTFEAGRVVDPTTGATRVSGSVALETAAPLAGTTSARIVNSSTSYLERSWTAADDSWVAATIRFTAAPTAAVRILQLSDAGTTIGNLQLQVNGALRLRNGSTTVGSDSGPLAAGTTYRIAIHQKRGTGANAVLEAFVAPVGTSLGAPFSTGTNGTWTTAADRLRIGATAGGSIDLTMDDVVVDDGPPVVTATATAAAQTFGSSARATFICVV